MKKRSILRDKELTQRGREIQKKRGDEKNKR